MDVKNVKAAFFSPTGTTRAVVRAIVAGIVEDSGAETSEFLDATLPDARKKPLAMAEDDLLVIGVPVYMGRVPALLGDWLNSIRLRATPTVCVVVYGNRAYEDALLELKNMVEQCGGVPVACAAYVGEHSFSTPERPTAQGRPDKDDLAHAQEFGRKVRAKVQSLSAAADVPELVVPGVLPYRKDSKLWDVDFIAVSEECTQCGACAEACPTEAIDPQDAARIDPVKCITCCACIKLCPQGARSMKPGPVLDASVRLNTLFKERCLPECFM